MTDKLTAIYYSGSHPTDRSLFAGACLYFDEVHFIGPSDDASSKETYTLFLSKLHRTGLTLGVIGDTQSPEAKREIQRASAFLQFVLDAQPLIGNVVYYHPHLQANEIQRITGALLGGRLTQEQWREFEQRTTSEARLLAAFAREHPELDDALLARLLPTARELAAKQGYIPVSDNELLEVPVVSAGSQLADMLASAAGLAVMTLVVPMPLWTNADDLLEIRDALSTDIVNYRVMSLKLAGRLRSMLRANAGTAELREEAVFLAKTEVLPHVAAIRRRVEGETGKLWRRVFGSALKWMSLGISSYIDPTGTALANAINEAGKDITHLTESAQGISLAGDPGLSFLFRLEKQLSGRA